MHRLRRLRSTNSESDDESDIGGTPPSRPPIALPVPPVSSDIDTNDPFDGHTPTDSNLAPCQCDPPDDPAAPCNTGPPTPAPTRQQTPPRPSSLASSSNNPIPLAPAISPHPRPIRGLDVSRRIARSRPNYGPSLSAILKSHLGI